MAEIEGAVEVIEEAESGIADEAGEASEEMGSEEKAEFEEVVENSQAEVKELSETATAFEDFKSGSLKTFGNFVMKNAAIAAIFHGVSVFLTKLIHQTGCTGQQQKSRKKTLAVVKAIVDLIKTENAICKTIKEWLLKHKNDTITLGGFLMKMESIFEEKLQPISDAIGKAYVAARPLMTKVNGKTQWNLPKEGDIHNLLEASESLIKAFGNLRDFSEEHKKKFVVLKTLLGILTPQTLIEIQRRMDTIKDMPFE